MVFFCPCSVDLLCVRAARIARRDLNSAPAGLPTQDLLRCVVGKHDVSARNARNEMLLSSKLTKITEHKQTTPHTVETWDAPLQKAATNAFWAIPKSETASNSRQTQTLTLNHELPIPSSLS